MSQEMYKHDALLHLVWSVATADKKPGAEKSVTPDEDDYLDLIRSNEKIIIDWTDFNAKRKSLGHKREVIIDEACKALRGCGRDWKIKCLGYMKRMAWVSEEDDPENNMSDKEWNLILRAQQELGLTKDERDTCHKSLPKFKANGPVKKYYNNGQLKVDSTKKDGKYHGPYKKYYNNGQLEIDSAKKDGKWHGPYKSYYENGQLEWDANKKDGKWHGPYIKHHENGKLKIKGENLLEGTGLKWFFNENGVLIKKCLYEADELVKTHFIKIEHWDNGKKKCQELFSDENCYLSQKNGLQQYWYENGQLKKEANFKDGENHGVIREFYENGHLEREGEYLNYNQIGVWKNYFKNGKLKHEYNYNNDGQYHGRYLSYYENGQLEEQGEYKNWDKVGVWNTYHQNGQIKSTLHFNNEGEIYGSIKRWWKDGSIMYETELINGTGIDKAYYDNKNLKLTREYKNGKADGLFKEWHENGQIKKYSNCKNGSYVGLRIVYDKHGDITEYEIWDGQGDWKEYDINIVNNTINLFKKRTTEKLSVNDICGFITSSKETVVREICDRLYFDGFIQREGKTEQWHRYFAIEIKKENSDPEKSTTNQTKISTEQKNTKDPISELRKFKALLDEGLIDQSDYEEKKNELLGLDNSKENAKVEVKAEPVIEEAKQEAPNKATKKEKSTRKFKGNFGEITLTINADKSCSGKYQKAGELNGTFINEEFSGQWKNGEMQGLVVFKIENGELNGGWKKGLEKGKMRGKWKGKEI